MSLAKPDILPNPPSLMKSLMAGFDTISNHIGLILFSIILDLMLWLGPRIRLASLFQEILGQLPALPESQSQEMVKRAQETLGGFNLFSALRTFPVGMPSLMAGRLILQNPLGEPIKWEIPSFAIGVGIWIAITLLGLTAGTLYFLAISQAAVSGKLIWREALLRWPWASLQVLKLALLWIILLFSATLPVSCILFFTVSGVGLEQMGLFSLLILGGIVIWLLLPMVFSPHGIFVNQKSTWDSIKTSIRLTRLTMPTTSLLILVLLVMSEGLDRLWIIPQESSWLLIIGILGHAFVTASLLAASFVYYYDADSWMKGIIQEAKLSSV